MTIDDKALTSKLDSLGKTFLLSNHPTLSPFELAWLYRQQYTVERAFKYIKSPSLLAVRSIYHWTDESIRGHLFTCVLGLLLLMLLVRKIQLGFKKMSLFEIVDYLSEIEFALVRYKGSRKVIKKIVEISPEARKLSEFLKLKHFM
ncbi:MAG: IS1634 family transposase [Promethearchaeota archaeon]